MEGGGGGGTMSVQISCQCVGLIPAFMAAYFNLSCRNLGGKDWC